MIRIEPLYDVTVSPLRFELNFDCDMFGESEPKLYWTRPDGTGRALGLNMYGLDEEVVLEFGGLWQEASRATDLREPVLMWYEADPLGIIQLLVGRSDMRLLPGATRNVVHYDVAAENDEWCTATLRYTVTISLRSYPVL
jgi:hypothetical protein